MGRLPAGSRRGLLSRRLHARVRSSGTDRGSRRFEAPGLRGQRRGASALQGRSQQSRRLRDRGPSRVQLHRAQAQCPPAPQLGANTTQGRV